jgi:hypothetical protein
MEWKKTGSVRIMQYGGSSVQPFLQWKSSITYCECVFVALGILNAMRMRHIDVCGLPGSTIFFPHYLKKGKIFRKKVAEHKMRVLIFSTNFTSGISHSKKK